MLPGQPQIAAREGTIFGGSAKPRGARARTGVRGCISCEICETVWWPRNVGATYFCVIRSAPLQQLQLAAGRRQDFLQPRSLLHLGRLTWAPAVWALWSFRQGQPRGRWGCWDSRVTAPTSQQEDRIVLALFLPLNPIYIFSEAPLKRGLLLPLFTF